MHRLGQRFAMGKIDNQIWEKNSPTHGTSKGVPHADFRQNSKVKRAKMDSRSKVREEIPGDKATMGCSQRLGAAAMAYR